MKLGKLISHLKHNSIKIDIKRFFEVENDIVECRTVYNGTVGEFNYYIDKNKYIDLNVSRVSFLKDDTFIILLEEGD